ncbi:MAG TPA: MFS transporter [Thermofilum sp.]|nr:MFS transporter [Thermofilum sp.]
MTKKSFKLLTIYIVAVLVSRAGSALITPVLPYYIVSLNIDMTTYGLIATIARVLSNLIRMPVAALIPVIGYFKSEGIAITLLGASRSLYAVSAALGGSLLVFTIGYAVSFLQFPFARITRASIVSKFAPSERRSTVLGLISSLVTLATTVGPLIGGYLYQDIGLGFVEIFSLSSILVLLSLPILFPLFKDNELGGDREKETSFSEQLRRLPQLLRTPDLGKAMAILSVDAFIWGLTHDYVSIYLAKYINAKPVELAYANTVLNAITLLGFAVTGFISDRVSRRVPFMILSEVAGAVYFFLLASAEDMLLVYLAYVFMGLVICFWEPITTAYISEISETVSPNIVPLTIGAWSFITSLARLPAGLLGGYMFDVLGPRALFRIVLVMVISEIFLLMTLREPRKAKDNFQTL